MSKDESMIWALSVDGQMALYGALDGDEFMLLGLDALLDDPVARAQGLKAVQGLLAQAEEYCELVALTARASSYFWEKVEEFSLAKGDDSLTLAFGDPLAAKQSIARASEKSWDLQAGLEGMLAEVLFITELLESDHMPSLFEEEEPEGAAGFAGEGRRVAATVLRMNPIYAKYIAWIHNDLVIRAGSKDPVDQWGLDTLRDAVEEFVISEEEVCVKGLHAALPQFQEHLAKELGCDKASLKEGLASLHEVNDNMT